MPSKTRYEDNVNLGRAIRTIERASGALREQVTKESSPEHLRDVIRELLDGDLGLSSMAICGASVGMLERCNHPIDPDDLSRCVELLRRHPWMREPAFSRLRNAKHTPWPRLIKHWDELVSMLIQEISMSTNCNKTYMTMKNIGC